MVHTVTPPRPTVHRKGSNPPPPGPRPSYNCVPASPAPAEDSTRSAAVDKGYHWIKINAATPLGVKLHVINRPAGVASHDKLKHTGPQFWTHYALMPTFVDDEDSHPTR